MAEDVVILEPGDERAQKISKAMGSQTASDILQLLAESKKSLTEITERLSIPLTTAKYHIENLLDAGLISVAETRYSVKGREIKIYTLTNQLLIVAPRSSNVRSLLLKYASLFCIVILGTLALSLISPLINGGIGMNAPSVLQATRETGTFTIPAAAENYLSNATTAPEITAAVSKGISDATAANMTPSVSPFATLVPTPPVTPAPVPIGSGSPPATAVIPDPALAFFLGGLLVILVLVIYEIYIWKKS